MPKSKKLQKEIVKKLEQLQKLLDGIDEVRIVNPDDSDTWDSDILYNLVANCKAVIKFLEDKKHLCEKDPWGEPLILEAGLCSLVNEYTSEDEEDEDNYE